MPVDGDLRVHPAAGDGEQHTLGEHFYHLAKLIGVLRILDAQLEILRRRVQVLEPSPELDVRTSHQHIASAMVQMRRELGQQCCLRGSRRHQSSHGYHRRLDARSKKTASGEPDSDVCDLVIVNVSVSIDLGAIHLKFGLVEAGGATTRATPVALLYIALNTDLRNDAAGPDGF